MKIVRCVVAGFCISVRMMIAAAPAVAQKTDRGLRPDSAAIPADTVRLPSHLVGLGGCHVLGYRVVTDSAVVKRLWQWRSASSPTLATCTGARSSASRSRATAMPASASTRGAPRSATNTGCSSPATTAGAAPWAPAATTGWCCRSCRPGGASASASGGWTAAGDRRGMTMTLPCSRAASGFRSPPHAHRGRCWKSGREKTMKGGGSRDPPPFVLIPSSGCVSSRS